MPGTRTSLFIVSAARSRNCWRLRPDRMVICTLGMDFAAASVRSSLPFARGKRIVRAARVTAFSN